MQSSSFIYLNITGKDGEIKYNEHIYVKQRYKTKHTHTRLTALFRATQVSLYQKGKTSLDFIEARDSDWQWHLLGRMQVCTSVQADNHASTPALSFFAGRMPFLPPNEQRQSTEGYKTKQTNTTKR